MFKRNSLLICSLLCFISTISLGADDIWNNSAGDNNWNTTSNWSLSRIPNSTDNARINIATGPVINSGQTVSAYRIYLEGSNGTLTINGGSFTATNHIYTAAVSTDTSTMNANGGTVTMANFYVGRNGTANINIAGGTVNCAALYMRTNGGIGTINITQTGKLIITGDVTANITTWVNSGWIKAYNGAGTIQKDYNITTAGKTTVWASMPTKAGGPVPANGAANASILSDLAWTGVAGALSHDVYFGTSSTPSFAANTTSTTFDVGRLAANTAYYWRIDEVTDSGKVAGDVWNFTTGNIIATNPTPANNAVNVSLSGATLSWTSGVTAASHNVYFGTANPPAFIGNQTASTFSTGVLATDKKYYWRIDEVEDAEHVYTGSVWNFTTQGSFRKGPYLIYPGSNDQMTVLWQIAATLGCTLEWGTDTSYSAGSTSTTEFGTDHQHKYTITGLTPGTKYFYRITAGPATATGTFKTAPSANATAVKFFAYGDTRTNAVDHSTISAAMNSLMSVDPDFQTMLLHVGDWVESDSETNWTNEFFNRSYQDQLQMEASLPIQGTIGNHEGSAVCYTKYWPYPYVSGKYWSFDYGPAHISIIDQYSSDYSNANSPQIAWLRNDLASSNKKWKFVMFHNPGWSAGGGHSNDTDVQNIIQPLCEQYGVQVVFAGHNHYYSRAVVNGVHHVTTGAGGAPLYNPSTGPNIILTSKSLEFCKVIIDGNSLTVQAVKPDGTVIDTFYVEKEEPDFTFVQATDPQIGWMYSGNNCSGQNMDFKWQETINKINIKNPAFAVVTGDLVDSKSNTSAVDYYNYCAAQLKSTIPLYQLPGNHDVDDAPSPTSYAIWQNNFSSSGTANPWFSFTYGNNLFICLDSMILKNPANYPGKNTEEMTWLTNQLQNSTNYDNVMVFMHIPICMTSVTETDGSNNMPLGTGNGIRKQLLDLFHQYNVKAVFSGHAHYNSYVRDGNLELITTSSCLCSLGSPATEQGFRIVKVYPTHIEHSYVTLPEIIALPGDFNGDGRIDFKDIGIISSHWLDGGIWP
jgi:hypothetical protein